MILHDYRIDASHIPGAGKGLFLKQAVTRGRVLVAPTDIPSAHLVSAARLDALPESLARASIRWFENTCTVDPAWSDECYINHSFSPNGLWHLGFVFALEDLAAGSELTVDYRMLLAEGASPGFADALTGREIRGFCWRESLQHSGRLLQQLADVSPLPQREPEPA